MGIRIDITSEGPRTVVHISGRLCGLEVAEVTKACARIEGAFVLDLSSVMSADDHGIEVIRRLAETGAAIRGVSPFIRLLLDDQPPREAKSATHNAKKGD